LSLWLAREDLGKQRMVAANQVLQEAENTTKKEMDLVMKGAEEASTQLTWASWAMVIGLAIGTIVGIVAGVKLGKSISGPIQRIAELLMASGEQTTSASGQVSAASQALAEGASEQAASLEETSSSLEEMASMTKRNADNAVQAKSLANDARTSADNGANDVKEMSLAMSEIKAASDGVAKILKTIDEIAFQTNILALNAAVEAARAGEAGAGFSVVADEVRNLAQRCAIAAKETAQKTEDSILKSTRGVEISQRVAKGLSEILDKARKVDELVGEIASASQEQRQGIEQINLAMSQMDKVTQSSAASAEETASAAEELNAQAEALVDAVADLNLIVQGSDQSYEQQTPAPKKMKSVPSKIVRASAPARVEKHILSPQKRIPMLTGKKDSNSSDKKDGFEDVVG